MNRRTFLSASVAAALAAPAACPGDDQANRLFTRNYRAPFVVPSLV
jgi:hypothetical protein